MYIVYLGMWMNDDPRNDTFICVLDVALSLDGARKIALEYIKDDYLAYWAPVDDRRWTHTFDALEFLGANGIHGNAKGRAITIIEQQAVP